MSKIVPKQITAYTILIMCLQALDKHYFIFGPFEYSMYQFYEADGSRRFSDANFPTPNFPKPHFSTTNFPKDIFSENQNYN